VMFLTAWVADRAGRVAVDQVHQCSLQMDCTTCSSSQTTFDRERRWNGVARGHGRAEGSPGRRRPRLL